MKEIRYWQEKQTSLQFFLGTPLESCWEELFLGVHSFIHSLKCKLNSYILDTMTGTVSVVPKRLIALPRWRTCRKRQTHRQVGSRVSSSWLCKVVRKLVITCFRDEIQDGFLKAERAMQGGNQQAKGQDILRRKKRNGGLLGKVRSFPGVPGGMKQEWVLAQWPEDGDMEMGRTWLDTLGYPCRQQQQLCSRDWEH